MSIVNSARAVSRGSSGRIRPAAISCAILSANPSSVDVTFLNRTDELIFLNQVRGRPVRTVLRGQISGTSTTSEVPVLPGTPPDGASIDRVHFEDRLIARGGRSYITTPPTCPRSRRWINSTMFTYADGVTQTVRTASPCRRRKLRAPTPRRRARARAARHDAEAASA